VKESEGNLSCSYPNTTSNAISNFFDPLKMNTINQNHSNNVNLLTNAWEIRIVETSYAH
jgi:hypothetical protein